MSDSIGTIISSSQFTTLLAGAYYEKWLSPNELAYSSENEWYKYPRFQQEYQDLLISILLFGKASVSIPSYILEHIDAEKLVREELLEFNTFDASQSLHKQLNTNYKEAFSKYRELEVNKLTAPIISLDDDLDDILDDSLSAQLAIDRINFCTEGINSILRPLIEGLQAIFGYYLELNLRSHLYTYHDFNDDFMRNRLFPTNHYVDLSKYDPRHSLFEKMGLFVQGPESHESLFSLYSYSPTDFENFHEIDRMLRVRDGGFEDHLEVGLSLSMRQDPNEFLYVHSFWKSLFELNNMLQYSNLSNYPLFLPSNTNIAPISEHLFTNTTTEKMIQVYKLFLTERGLLPNITSLDQLLKLREDKRLKPLKKTLTAWLQASKKDDIELLNVIRVDIEKAKKEIENLSRYQRVASLIGYISLPVGAVDLIQGSPFGLLLAPIGPAIDLYSRFKLRKVGWVNFGA